MIVLLIMSVAWKMSKGDAIPPNAGLNATEQIKYYGYPLEIHEVTTEDGYILQLHRIPYSPNDSRNVTKEVVFLMPGFLSCSGVFMLNGPNKSLAFKLADKNYDVWIGNGRGTTYSRKHVIFDPDVNRVQFWNFSIHEVGYYDVRSSIDYVLNTTQKQNLIYIGHSQGPADFFILASEFPEYNKKVRLVVALSPISYMSNARSLLLRLLTAFTSTILSLSKLLGIYEIFYYSKFYLILGKTSNRLGKPLQFATITSVFLFVGFDYQQFNYTLLPVITSIEPAGASIYQAAHYGQLVNSGKFRQFDYGEMGNLKHYGQITPPDYRLEKVDVPVAIYYGSHDWCATPEDISRLVGRLPNVVRKKLILNWQHCDFIWAKDINKYLNDDVTDLIARY